MSPVRHPSRRQLQRWLAGEAPRRVDRHVDSCDHCQSLLEQLTALGDELVADLHEALSPPDDLADRTAGGVEQRLRDEAAFGSFLDLFAIGWNFTRAIVDPEAHLAPTEADENDGDIHD